MTYRLSDLDRKNTASFQKDASNRSLTSITLRSGTIRGLSNFSIEFSYPLAAIAGRNGSGKSTVLALAACAYHSHPKGWSLPGRKYPHYRFSDFFVQTHDEVPVDGVLIEYGILHDKWKPTETLPAGKGVGYQQRRKNAGGKWNDYANRLKRPVAFFGIDRVVPPSERSVLKNQRNYFSFAAANKSKAEDLTRASVSRVLGIEYQDFELRGSGYHRLPLVKRKTCSYSGFNMGAGEQALFGLFSAIHSAKDPTLFVIDEIELGLHEAAQKGLIFELKKIAFALGHQFVFTTHSPVVLENLPPNGRFFLESGKAGTQVIEGISPAFAAGRMSGAGSAEVIVYVEDSIARQLVVSALDSERRKRVKVIEVGSHSAVISQAAAKFIDREHDKFEPLFLLDGDQRAALSAHKTRFLGLVDQRKKSAASSWFDERVAFLPSEVMPERYVVGKVREDHVAAFCTGFGIENAGEASDMLDRALIRGDHSELFSLSEDLFYPVEHVWLGLCAIISSESGATLDEVRASVDSLLS